MTARETLAPCSRSDYEVREFAFAAQLFAHHVATCTGTATRFVSPSVPDILSCVVVRTADDEVVVTGQFQSVGFRLAPAAPGRSPELDSIDRFVFPPTEMHRYVDAARRFFDLTPADEERCESFLEERRPDVALYDIRAALTGLVATSLTHDPEPPEGAAGTAALLALLADLIGPSPASPHAKLRKFGQDFRRLAAAHKSLLWAYDMGRVATRQLHEGRDVSVAVEQVSVAFRAAGLGGVLPTIGRVASRRIVNAAAILHRMAVRS